MTSRWLTLAASVLLVAQISTTSVLPKPHFSTEPATTHHTAEAILHLVTSSELPKQIPPPPTPTRPHQATPRYETTRIPLQLQVWIASARQPTQITDNYI